MHRTRQMTQPLLRQSLIVQLEDRKNICHCLRTPETIEKPRTSHKEWQLPRVACILFQHTTYELLYVGSHNHLPNHWPRRDHQGSPLLILESLHSSLLPFRWLPTPLLINISKSMKTTNISQLIMVSSESHLKNLPRIKAQFNKLFRHPIDLPLTLLQNSRSRAPPS